MKPYYTDPFTMLGLFGFYVTTKFLLFPTTKTIENLLTNMSHVSYFKLTLHDWIMEEMVKYISVSAFFFCSNYEAVSFSFMSSFVFCRLSSKR